MATYTITLRELIKAGYQIFDDSWGTFVPEHKAELCNKIIRHYWFYEIGCETADRFKWNINEHLSLIMPYYNKLFQSELWELEPLYNLCFEDTTANSRDRATTRNRATRNDINRLKQMAESMKKLAEGTSDLTGTHDTVYNETWKEDRTIDTRKVTDQDTTEKTDQTVDFTEKMTQNTDYKEDVTQKTVFAETVDTTTNEVMSDTVDGTKDTTGTSHTTTSNTRRYSDTPQGQITSSGGLSIDAQYLTNYTAESGSSDTTTTSKETIHNQEDKTTDTTQKRETSSTQDMTKGTTSNEDVTRDTTSKETTDKDVVGTNDVTETTHTTDDVVGSRDKTQNVKDVENVITTSKEHDFSNGSEDERTAATAYENEGTKDGEKSETKRVYKGFTESQAALLKQYRQILINIDQQIIEALNVEFMGIF